MATGETCVSYWDTR